MINREKDIEKKNIVDIAKDRIVDAKRKYDNFQLFISFVGAIYFIFNLIISVTKNFKDSNLFPYILGLSIIYIVVFAAYLIIHKKDSKQIKKDTKNFKSYIKIVKLFLNLLFIGSSLLIFIESLNTLKIESGLINIFQTLFSGLLLFIKVITTFFKLVKTIKKRIKAKKKETRKESK